jgi:hypothetical protein
VSNDKAEILKAIKQAEQAKLIEQETYRKTVKAALATPVTEDHFQRLEQIGWGGILDHMAGEQWPPHSTDWKELYGLEWDETPKHKQLRQINDEDISLAVYMLSEISDHADRLKAAATFFSLFGATSQLHDALFSCWVQQTLEAAMAAEQLQSSASEPKKTH